MNKELDDKSYFKLLNTIISGCKFKYFSYDHKEALEEYKTSDEYKVIRKYIRNPNSHDMPDDLKEKYRTERVGKLRSVHFNPSGRAFRFKIGARYAKTYYIEDFGVSVFPLEKE